MMNSAHIILFVLLTPVWCLSQQKRDSSEYMKEVQVTGIRTVHGTGHLPPVKECVIYSGKKNEVILVDSLDANKAMNNTRQIMGRIPGLVIVETESGGFTANGIATRGLNPSQSLEVNTRQDGYNISADTYGYNESYYLPPMEAVSRIEMVRGASSLQFGAQFGGMVNYVLSEAPKNRKLEWKSAETVGSYGLFNTFNSIGGTLGKWNYYGFVQYRKLNGWRPNSEQWQVSGFGRLEYRPSNRIRVGAAYSLLRNRVHMPGGLTDSMFEQNARSSFRSRNWLKSPWNVLNGYVNYSLNAKTSLTANTTYLFSNRSLVWRNEDGGAGAPDTIDAATGEYVPREVEKEDMHSVTTELRLVHRYAVGKVQNTVAAGLRYSYAWFKRLGGGEGTTGSDFDLRVTGGYEYALDFTTANLAAFMEHLVQIGSKLSVTPGIRWELLKNTTAGYITDGDKVFANNHKQRSFPLLGLGVEYRAGTYTNLYANISQAYRPIDYSQLTPIGVSSKIDPNLKDAYGYNADLGYRGTVKQYLNFDLGVFYLAYNRRIGTLLLVDASGNPFTYRTNVANSVHKGIEVYGEFDLLKYLHPFCKRGLAVFTSFGYTDARYTSGEFKGNRVEASVRYVNRSGITYHDPRLSFSIQMNNTGDAYGDATNARASSDPVAGYIAAYTVFDVSGTYKLRGISLKAGINNAGNKTYFTRRTDEYPGPGILSAVGRSVYISLSTTL